MDEKRHKITSSQLMTFILATQVGTGILTLPSDLAKIVGHDGWISVLLVGIIATFSSIIIVKLMERYKNQSIYGINKLLYGKYLGTAINIILLLYFIIVAAVNVRIFLIVVRSMVLKSTPPLILTIFIIIPSFYLVWYGLKSLCRFNITVYFSMFAVVFLLLLTSKFFKLTFLMPFGEAGLNQITSGAFSTFYSLLGFEIITVIYPYITDKDKTVKYMAGANIISVLFSATLVITTTAFFGENMLKHLVFPLFSLARSYKAPILERIDLYIIALWFPPLAMSVRAYLFATYNTINKVFDIRRKTLCLVLLIAAVIILSRIPKSMAELYIYVGYANIFGIIIIGFFVLSYVFSFINNKNISCSK